MMRGPSIARLVILVATLAIAEIGTLPAAPFVRGDANGDAAVDITDVVHLLRFLFLRDGAMLECREAADADDSGALDITDPIVLFEHLFKAGPTPRAPYPACGFDPTADALGCVSYPLCRLAPTASFTAAPLAGEAPLAVAFDASASSDPDGSVTGYSWRFGDGTTASGIAASHVFVAPGKYRVTLEVTDDAGNSAIAEATIEASGPTCSPAEPSLVAPAIDLTVSTALHESAAFLYQGPDPVQRGVTVALLDPRRAAVLRGQVFTRLDSGGPAAGTVPLGGVEISVLGHPEYGQTCTRADGRFDMAVNGGGRLTVVYSRPGYHTSHRAVDVPWQDFAHLSDVEMLRTDWLVAKLEFGTDAPLQVFRGPLITDALGSRRPTLLLHAGTTLELLPSGGRGGTTFEEILVSLGIMGVGMVSVAELFPLGLSSVRGAMLEHRAVAEGTAAGARLNRPFSLAVENFPKLPVGTALPQGRYDRSSGVWVPEADGRVVRIVGEPGGVAAIDIDGDGAAESTAALASLDLTIAVRTRLAELYDAGAELLWTPVPLGPSGLALPVGCPGAPPPAPPPPRSGLLDDPARLDTFGVEVENQVVERTVRLAGTPLALHYSSARVPGLAAERTLLIPLTSNPLPSGLLRVELEVSVAGQLHRTAHAPAPDSTASFTWDGKDAYGRTVQGGQPVTARIGYVYPGKVLQPAAGGRSFGRASGKVLSGAAPAPECTLWREWRGTLGGFDARGLGLGGWTLSAQHVCDLTGRTLHFGTGERKRAANIGAGMSTAAASPAVRSEYGLAAGPDGSLYIADRELHRIHRLDLDGNLKVVAGASGGGFAGDGGPADLAKVLGPSGVCVGLDGSLYIADTQNQRIRRVDGGGIIHTVAGKGTAGSSGDGGQAVAAELNMPAAAAVGPDGVLYIADSGNHRIRRVGTDGTIAPFAGTGVSGKGAPGRPAVEVDLNDPRALAVDREGTVYVADTLNHRVLRVRGGAAELVMGNINGSAGDGGPAELAYLSSPQALAFAPDRSLLISDYGNYCVRRVGHDGIASTFAGTAGNSSPNGDLGLAAAVRMGYVWGLAASPDGAVFIADQGNVKVRRAAPVIGGVTLRAERYPVNRGPRDPVSRAIGQLVHEVDARGRHQATRDALTGAVLWSLEYDLDGHLISLTDGAGNATRVLRGLNGLPRAIVAPGGQTTLLAVDSDGFLSRVTDPSGAAWRFSYGDGGLLAAATDSAGGVARYEYDALGRLAFVEGVGPSCLVLERREEARAISVSIQSALGRIWEHRVERALAGGEVRSVVFPAGLETVETRRPDGSRKVSYPDLNPIQGSGTIVEVAWTADPRLGVLAAYPAASSLHVPLIGPYFGSQSRSVSLSDPKDPASLVSQTDSIVRKGRTWKSEYAQSARTFTLTSPAGRKSTVKLDDRGRVIEEGLEGLAPLRYQYDAKGRWAAAAQGTGAAERAYRFADDAADYLETITDPLGRVTRFAYDAAGRRIRMVLPGGAVVEYPTDPSVYATDPWEWLTDAGEHPLAVAPPGRPPHFFAWAPDGRLSGYTPPDAGAGDPATRFNYDAERALARITRPGEETVDLHRDGAGRLALLELPGSSILHEYDAVTGNLKQSGVHSIPVDLAYQFLGPVLTSETWSGPFSARIGLGYAEPLKVTSTSIGGANSVDYQFETDNLADKAFASTVHGNPLLEITRHPQHGLITALRLGQILESRTLNVFGEVDAREVTAGGSQVYRAAAERDLLGRLTKLTETVGSATLTFEYRYSPAGELVGVMQNGSAVAAYTYDPNGNRTSVQDPAGISTAAFDAQDRLLLQGAVSCGYTPAGELKRKTKPGGTTAYTHDALGNLLAVALPDGTRVDYVHDARGRRIGTLENGVFRRGLVYRDSTRPLAELGETRGIATLFVYASGGRAPDFMITNQSAPAGADYYFVRDHRGSVRLVISMQTGAIAERIDYDPFGNITLDTNPALQPFGFLGGVHDRQTGLVRLGGRDYDPELGRFIAKDPSLERFLAGETNLYALGGNDPVNWPTDPSEHPTDPGFFTPRAFLPEDAAAWQERLAPSRLLPFLPEGPAIPGLRLRGLHRRRLEEAALAADPQAVENAGVPVPWISRSRD